MSEEKSEKKWAYGDAVYMRAMVVSVGKGGVGVRTDDPSQRTAPGFVDIIVDPGALIEPETLAAELSPDRIAIESKLDALRCERDAARAELEAIRFVLNGDAEGLTAKAAVHQFTGVAARVASDLAARTAERDALCAELTTTRDDLQRTDAAMWEPLRGVAAALGYHRASAPDFGEIDEVGVREWVEVLKERRDVQQNAARELADVLRERLAALESQLVERADERDLAERRLAIAERVIGRRAIEDALASAEVE